MARGLIRTQRIKQAVSARKMRADTVGRSILLNREQVMRSARAKTGHQVRADDYDPYIGDVYEGMGLKRGVMGMAEVVSPYLTEEEMAKISAMDETALSALYQNNKFVFEVAFNYGGIKKDGKGAYDVSESKADDMRFLIKQYESYYGAL